ncbi:ADP-ribosylation factor-like protein 6-interacting protein 4 [Daphnia carinata]|uniref:ADP-ribosylation factor-like protein 6-interacting protein 4 n=1 Tax=Daphnia carinata TaxID=120202 RepID=UPI002580CFAE|nr:ADP-ribosylation factor-like protein 6-interacting protein 4 [Daphnia carinata]
MDGAIVERSRSSKCSMDSKIRKKKGKKDKKTSRKKHSKKSSRKRHVSSSSESSSSSSCSSESSKEEKAKKRKKRSKKHKSKKVKANQETLNSQAVVEKKPLTVPVHTVKLPIPDVGPHVDLNSSKSRAPMTKEEYEKQQNTLRRIVDPETGRKRLIRGSGEIVEEIVSRERHQAINRKATIADGNFFQAQANLKARSSYD